MDWIFYLTILAQVLIGAIVFLAISFPVSWGLSMITDAVRKRKIDRMILSGSRDD